MVIPARFTGWQRPRLACPPVCTHLMQQNRASHVSHLLVLVPAAWDPVSIATMHGARGISLADSPACPTLLRFGNEIRSLLVAKVDLVAQHVYVKELPDILASVIACWYSARTFRPPPSCLLSIACSLTVQCPVITELFPDLGKLLIYSSLLLLLVLACANILNEVLRAYMGLIRRSMTKKHQVDPLTFRPRINTVFDIFSSFPLPQIERNKVRSPRQKAGAVLYTLL